MESSCSLSHGYIAYKLEALVRKFQLFGYGRSLVRKFESFGYERLTISLARYAKVLCFALKVLGANLFG